MCYQNVFRTLRPDEIECRVAQSGKTARGAWASFLLYKDARVDQRIMDETFGPMNWQSEYSTIDGKMFCKVSVWDKDKQCWISKMNIGSESNTEPDKGLASDCLKRACFTWGLGVELYSSPKIFVNLNEGEYDLRGDKIVPHIRLYVSDISYSKDRKVANLSLSDNKGVVRYKFSLEPEKAPKTAKERDFVSRDGKKKLTVGDFTWRKAVEQTAKDEVCKDGTPIPIWLADTYNLPDDVMKKFTEEVKQIKENANGNA